MDVEELGSAPVEADGLALVDIALEVVVGDALLCAGLVETFNNRELALGWDRYIREGGLRTGSSCRP